MTRKSLTLRENTEIFRTDQSDTQTVLGVGERQNQPDRLSKGEQPDLRVMVCKKPAVPVGAARTALVPV